jgi:drug/metabolite transporter (DMT)-like permease
MAYFSPGHVALIRFLSASAVLLVYAVVVKLPFPKKEDFPRLAALGFLGVSLYHTVLNYGLLTVSAGPGSMIVNSAPIFTALLAAYFLKERLSGRTVAGLAVSMTGVVLIGLGEGRGFRFEPGALLLIAAALGWALNIITQKPLLEKYSPRDTTCYAVFIGTIPLLLYAPGLAESASRAPIAVILGLIYLGALPIAVAYATWGYVLSQMPASRAASFLYLIPIVATITAWVFLKEVPPVMSLVGGALVLAGVAIVNAVRSTG